VNRRGGGGIGGERFMGVQWSEVEGGGRGEE